MRDGRIVQIGTPAEVWESPADAWVAAFLGFAPAVEAHGRGGEIDTPWGVQIDARNVGNGAVTVVVRPDAVRLEPAGAVARHVVRATFTGTSVRIVLRPEQGPDLTCLVAAAGAPAVGDAVRASFAPDGLLVYPGTAD